MATFILLNEIIFAGVALKKAKIIDDAIYDVAKIAASGGVLIAIPNPVVEARAAEVRQQQARGRREAELDDLTASSAESVDISGIPLATPLSAGLMSGPDKATLDALGFGVVLIQVRNESGVLISKGQLVAPSGFSVPFGLPLVDLADKDIGSRRPAIGMVQVDIPNNSNGFVITEGLIRGLDTSMFSLTDQLVLGNAGTFLRPPPDQDPFTGKVQNIGSVTRVHATLGEIIVSIDGLLPIPAEQFFALNAVPGHAFPFSAVQGALAVASSDISVNDRKITDVTDPTSPQDAATKAYADAVATGLIVKDSARAIAVAPIVLSGPQVIDGVAVVAADRVLVVGQGGSPAVPDIDNGLWIVAAGAWTRATDMAAGSSASGSFVFITEGTTYGSTGWVCSTTAGSDIVGTDPISFSQFSGVGQINAGDGLVKTGNTIDVVANADGSILANPNNVQVGVLATDAQHGVRGGGSAHAVATVIAAGFLSATDKTKLDGIAVGATNTPLASTAPTDVTKAAAVIGVGTTAARADHKHDVSTASATTILPDDSAAEGAATSLSRSDHKHAIAADVAGSISVGDAPAEGASTSFARADHVHGLAAPAAPANVTKAAAAAGTSANVAREDHKHDVTTAAPVTISTANAEGVAASIARSDHVHAHGALPGGSTHADVIAAGASGYMTGADKTKLDGISPLAAALTAVAPTTILPDDSPTVGVGTAAAREDHKHGITADTAGSILIGDSAAEGVATSFARSDHRHALAAPAAPADVTKTAASAGASTSPARADHKHDVTTAAPGTTTYGVAAEGAATSLARSDHAHAVTSPAAPVNVTKAAAAAGTATAFARDDHKHDVTTAVVVSIGSANAEGAATSLARSDHVHAGPSAQVQWGNDSVAATTTTRYLTPGYEGATARTTVVQITATRAGTMKNFRIHHTGAGNGNNVVYTLRVNGVASALTITLASTGTNGSDVTHTVAVAAGDLLDIEVTKAASIATSPSDIVATMEFAA